MTDEQIALELKRIQDSVPELWRKSVFKEIPKTPTMEFVAKKFIEDGGGTPEEREQVQNLLDTGEFSKKKIVEVPKFVKLIDNFVTREIKKSVKAGRLPKDASKFKYGGLHNQAN